MGVRKSVNFNVSVEAYEKVKEIFPDVIGTEDNLLQLVTAYKFWVEHKDNINTDNSEVIEGLEKKIEDIQETANRLLEERDNEIAKLKEQLSAAQEDGDVEIQKVVNEKQALEHERDSLKDRLDALEASANALPGWNAIKQTLQPFPAALLEETAARLSEYYGREITPMQVLIDMFLRYTIERNAEWFYPFVLRDADILAKAKEVNPAIESVKQIKKTYNFD